MRWEEEEEGRGAGRRGGGGGVMRGWVSRGYRGQTWSSGKAGPQLAGIAGGVLDTGIESEVKKKMKRT